MTVTFITTPYSNWQCLAPLLEAVGCVTPTSNESKQHSVDPISEMPAEGKLLLAYASPQQTLANAMEQGAAPTEVLSHWMAHTKAMIECFKANRKRVVLINIDAARQHLSQSAATLENHWQQQIELPEGQPSDSQHPPAEANPYYWMLATLAVHQSQELPLLLAQLEACTLPIGEAVAAPVKQIDHLYSELTALFQQCESSQVLAQEHEALQRQLKKEQADHAALKALNATLEKEHITLQATHKAQEVVLDNANEEYQLLLQQLHLVQEELERQIIAAKEAASEKTNLQHQLEARQKAHQKLEKEHASLKQAHQKEQTAHAQTKAEKLALEGQHRKAQQEAEASLSNVEQENQLLILQLHSVQEALEVKLLQAKEQEKELARREAKYQQAERKGALALASANRRIYELGKELNSITNSPRWKLVSPLNGHGKKSKKVRAEQLQQQKKQVALSGLFDVKWYLQAYPDIAEAAIDPIEHYLTMGAYEGRNPSEVFDTSWYLLYYQDVTDSGLNPLVHYIRYGHKENRATRPGALASLTAPTQQPAEKG